jgi:hypothetical protein
VIPSRLIVFPRRTKNDALYQKEKGILRDRGVAIPLRPEDEAEADENEDNGSGDDIHNEQADVSRPTVQVANSNAAANNENRPVTAVRSQQGGPSTQRVVQEIRRASANALLPDFLNRTTSQFQAGLHDCPVQTKRWQMLTMKWMSSARRMASKRRSQA